MLPPKTKRFCLSCEKDTVWHYNQLIGHSRCTECDGSHAMKKDYYHSIRRSVFKQFLDNFKLQLEKEQKYIQVSRVIELLEFQIIDKREKFGEENRN